MLRMLAILDMCEATFARNAIMLLRSRNTWNWVILFWAFSSKAWTNAYYTVKLQCSSTFRAAQPSTILEGRVKLNNYDQCFSTLGVPHPIFIF